MAIKKTNFHKSVQSELEYEIVDDPELIEEEADGACCVCDNPGTTQCAPEATIGAYFTLAGAQLLAFWGMR